MGLGLGLDLLGGGALLGQLHLQLLTLRLGLGVRGRVRVELGLRSVVSGKGWD